MGVTEHFVIVGAQRSGTTALYHFLEQHPDVCMATPIRPEPKFFLRKNATDLGYESYLEFHFAHRKSQPILGEKSTSYIERKDAIPRLRSILPNARLVFVLRDPARRAYSNWRFSRAHGLETLDFEAALDAEEARLAEAASHNVSVSPFAYAARGHYVRYLDRWAQTFPREQFVIVTSEHIFNGHESVRDVFRYLSLDPDIPLNDKGPVNSSVTGHPEPPAAAMERLRVHFQESNRILRDCWHVDISSWQ